MMLTCVDVVNAVEVLMCVLETSIVDVKLNLTFWNAYRFSSKFSAIFTTNHGRDKKKLQKLN